MIGEMPEQPESVLPPIGSPFRYAFDIHIARGNYGDLLLRTTEYLQHELEIPYGFPLDKFIRDRISAGELPSGDDYEKAPAESLELFRLLPINVLSDWKKYTLEPWQYKLWFMEAASAGLGGMSHDSDQNPHSHDCLDYDGINSHECQYSVNCPYLVIVEKIKRNADHRNTVDVHDPKPIDPKFIASELEVAQLFKLMDSSDVAIYAEGYEIGYDAQVGD